MRVSVGVLTYGVFDCEMVEGYGDEDEADWWNAERILIPPFICEIAVAW